MINIKSSNVTLNEVQNTCELFLTTDLIALTEAVQQLSRIKPEDAAEEIIIDNAMTRVLSAISAVAKSIELAHAFHADVADDYNKQRGEVAN